MEEPGPVWEQLKRHRPAVGSGVLRQLFSRDPDRFERFSLRADGLLLDVSKTHLTARTLSLLHRLAEARRLPERRAALFRGDAVNETENRAALHVALRAARDAALAVGGTPVMPAVQAERDRICTFAEKVRDGTARGSGGAPFSDVVHLATGGSALGPAMMVRALAPWSGDGPGVRFAANLDGADLADTLRGLEPGRTLFLVGSKTFTTEETRANARAAQDWIGAHLGRDAVAHHMAALTARPDLAEAEGFRPDRIFRFWDWVGGRYSTWSAIGLPVAIACGAQVFRSVLAGARRMDAHFLEAPADANLPLLFGLAGVWHRSVLGLSSVAVIPYDQRLALFPDFLQQLEMESNGKSVTRGGHDIDGPSAAVVWGGVGTSAQHSFFQALHQGSDIIPVEVLVAAEPSGADPRAHESLLAHCLAQTRALMLGRGRAEAERRLRADGMSAADAAALAPHRSFRGDRPSVTLVYDRLDPHTLGMLVALYEHRTFVQGTVWGLNSFDQWGVELGKEGASDLLPAIRGDAPADDWDGSTRGLLRHLRTVRGG